MKKFLVVFLSIFLFANAVNAQVINFPVKKASKIFLNDGSNVQQHTDSNWKHGLIDPTGHNGKFIKTNPLGYYEFGTIPGDGNTASIELTNEVAINSGDNTNYNLSEIFDFNTFQVFVNGLSYKKSLYSLANVDNKTKITFVTPLYSSDEVSIIRTYGNVAQDMSHTKLVDINLDTNYLHSTSAEKANYLTGYNHSLITDSNPHLTKFNQLLDTADVALKSGSITQIATRNHSDLQNINGSESYQHLTTAEVANITLKSGSITQITTRNHNDLQNLNAGSAHPSASIDNTSTSYGRGLATTDNTVQKVADRVNQNGTPQFVTDKTKCSLLLDFKGTLADRSRAINPIGSDAANKWTDNFVNDSTTKTSATNISCTLKQFDGDEGLFGSGIAVEESRTNLISNSENLSVAYCDGGTITLDRVENGQKIWKVVSTVTRGYIFFDLPSNIIYSAGQYTFSCSHILPSGYSFYVSNLIGSGEVLFSDTPVSKLTKVSKTYTFGSGTATRFRFVWFGSLQVGTTFYITSPQLEAGAFPTSYIATGATAVTRPAGKLNYEPKLIGKIGSISSWQKYEELGQAWQLITPFQATDGTNLFDIYGAASPYTFRIGGGSNDTFTYTFAINTWYHWCVTWDGTNIKVYINGVLTKTAIQGIAFGNFTSFQLAQNNNINSNFAIFNYALTADEISQIYNSGLEGKPIAITNPENIIPVGQSLHDTNFVTFTSGWGISTTYPNKPTLSKSSNVALMRGIIEYSGTVNSDVTLFTLPVGSRPSLPDTSYHSFVATARDSGAPSMRILRLYGNGDVVLMGQGATIVNPVLSLDNINYVNGK